MAVMTVLAIRAIPPSPKSGVFPRRDGLGTPSNAGPAPVRRRLLRASNSSVSARVPPEWRENIVFLMPPRATAVAL